MTESKLNKLDSIIIDLEPFIIAFSGGVDSSFLTFRSSLLRHDDVMAVTIRTPYIPKHEIQESVQFTKKHGITHNIIDIEFPEIIRNNPVDRCYLCKRKLFTEVLDFAKKNNYKNIVDGSNSDDAGEYRPGMRALNELGVRSPLMEAGLTKQEIRQLCRDAGLDIWDKPAMACLLTRIPYDTEVNERTLRMIETAELMLLEKGFPGARVRVHGDVARIECLPGFIEKLIKDPARELIITNLKKIGFRYVSVDLEGYRTGSFNPEIKKS